MLIVWDTVRAYNVSSYGYPRDTTPNLTQWARKGVRYDRALAAAPWTYPSHSCFLTGQWPYQLNTQWKFTLEYSRSNAGRVSEPLGAIKPPGLRRTQTAALTKPGWLGASPISRITRSRRGPAQPYGSGEVDPQKNPDSRRLLRPELGRFYDKKWATLQSRGAPKSTTASSTG